jgi:uncharacterized protein YdaU (DUF1376 family)
MSMNGLPYYKRFPRDLIEGTVGMPFEEKVTYAFILDLIYMHGGSLPDDARYISGALGCSVRKWTSLRSALLDRGKLQADLGIISNFRANLEMDNLKMFLDKQRENGSKPKKSKDLPEPSLKPKPNHTEPDTDIRTETNVSVARKRATPKTIIPPDALISEPMRAAAEQRGLSDAEAEAQFKRFRDWAVAKGQAYADWDAAWRNWLTSPHFRPVIVRQENADGQHSRRVSAFLSGARR